MAEKKHPGISMHKLPVGGDFVGLVFAAGTALIFLFGLPALWYFVAFSALVGIVLAFVFHVVHQRGSRSNKPLSILAEPTETSDLPPRREKRQRTGIPHLLPTTHSC